MTGHRLLITCYLSLFQLYLGMGPADFTDKNHASLSSAHLQPFPNVSVISRSLSGTPGAKLILFRPDTPPSTIALIRRQEP